MRLPLIPPAGLSVEQRPLYEDMRGGIGKSFHGFAAIREDGALMGPWNPWIYEPHIGKLIWDLTKALSRHSKLPDTARQVAILVLIRLEAESIGVPPPCHQGIDFPNPDFAAFARACGGHGFVARRPDELKKAISAALAIEGPAIVDAAVVANELPNLPHLDLELLGQVARAKIKEAVLAFRAVEYRRSQVTES